MSVTALPLTDCDSYNKIVKRDPKVCTAGSQRPINKLTDQLRAEIARAGFCEALTFALVRTSPAFAATARTCGSARLPTASPTCADQTTGLRRA